MNQVQPAKTTVAVRQPGIIDFPPRTRLYCLVPQAPESIWCESLTGYINRLGWAHHVSPRALVAEVINPLLPEPEPFSAVFCMQPAVALNGNSEQARTWAEAVGHLTGQPDLSLLTLTPLLGDFPPIRLLRRTPGWCATCVAEWKCTGQVLYQPLLWMLQVVTVCPTHQIPLLDRCPECHHRQKVLTTNKTQPFECTSCGIWLGEEASAHSAGEVASQLIVWQTWVISALEELHTASLTNGMLSWKSFFTQLSSYLKARRAYSRVAQAIGTGKENFHRWVNDQDPHLETLFKFCYRCEVTPWQVMNGKLDPLERIICQGVSCPSPLPPRFTRRLDREHCRAQLHAALGESSAPPSLHQVGQRLDVHTSLLMYHFPEECALIVQRHALYRNQRKDQRLVTLREDVRQAVFSLHARGEYPLRYKLSAFFPNGAMRQREATDAWREAMLELGLDPDNQHKAQMSLAPKSD